MPGQNSKIYLTNEKKDIAVFQPAKCLLFSISNFLARNSQVPFDEKLILIILFKVKQGYFLVFFRSKV